MRVSWTDQALDDLEAICLFIQRDSASPYTKLFVRRVFEAADSLAELPRRGRVVSELGQEDVRELILFGKYRLVYRINEDDAEVEVLTVHHGARPLEM